MRETLLLTMGDVCGIGPEIVAAAWRAASDARLCLVGDVGVMRRALAWRGLSLPVARLESPAELSRVPPDCLPVWQPADLPAGLLDCPIGRVDAKAGAAAAACITAAVQAIQAGQAGGLVTAPIHKEALHAAGVAFPGPHRDAAVAGSSGRGADAGAHDAGQRGAAHGAGDHPLLAAPGD